MLAEPEGKFSVSFSYNSDSPGDRDRLRLQIADTTSTGYVFEDSELDIFLSRSGSDINYASAMACRALAVNHAKRAIWYKVNGFMMERKDPAKRFLEMAQEFETAAKAAPFEFESITEDHVDSSGRDLGNYSDSEVTDA